MEHVIQPGYDCGDEFEVGPARILGALDPAAAPPSPGVEER